MNTLPVIMIGCDLRLYSLQDVHFSKQVLAVKFSQPFLLLQLRLYLPLDYFLLNVATHFLIPRYLTSFAPWLDIDITIECLFLRLIVRLLGVKPTGVPTIQFQIPFSVFQTNIVQHRCYSLPTFFHMIKPCG